MSVEASTEVEDLAQSVANQFASATDADVDPDEVAESLADEAAANEANFGLEPVEAIRPAASDLFQAQHDVDTSDYSLSTSSDDDWEEEEEAEPVPATYPDDENELISLRELATADDLDEWPDKDLVGRVAHLNENRSHKMAQVGLLSDGPFDADSINFKIFGKSASNVDFNLDEYDAIADYPHHLDEDEASDDLDFYSYVGTDREEAEGVPVAMGDHVRIRNYKLDERDNGKRDVAIGANTTIAKLDPSEVPDVTLTIQGHISEVKDGSGLIKRCPECSHTTSNGKCSEHGVVDAEYDIRIKAVVDVGYRDAEVIFNREATEALTGMTLEDAEALASEKMDSEAPLRELRSGGELLSEGLRGKLVEVEGTVFNQQYLFSQNAEFVTEVPDANAGLVRARELQS